MKIIKGVFLIYLLIFPSINTAMQLHKRLGFSSISNFVSNNVKSIGSLRSLHWSALKGTSTFFSNDKQQLSPLCGAALIEGGWIERLYNYGPDHHAMSTLSRSLFHQLENEFRPTHNKSLPGASLTPEITADILIALENNTFDSDEVRRAIMTKWLSAHKNIFNTTVTKAKIERLLDTISKAAQECKITNKNASYMPYTLQSILLGHLYKKAATKKDVQIYIEAIKKNMSSTVFSDYNKEDFAHDVYKDSDFKEKPELAIGALDEILGSGFEQGVVDHLRRKYSLPFVEQKAYRFGDKPPTPNCMEASMHNIFNKLLYNTTINQFDFSLLPSSLKPTPEFKEFYAVHGNVTRINEAIVGQAWMNLVSGKDFLRYKKDDYDLNPRVSNFVNVIKYCFNIEGEVSLDELAKMLSDERREVKFKKHNNEDTNNQIDIYLTDKKTHQTELLKLHLGAGHAWIETPTEQQDDHWRNCAFENIAWPFIDRKFSDCPAKEFKLSLLYPLVAQKRAVSSITFTKLPTPFLMHSYFSSNENTKLDSLGNMIDKVNEENYHLVDIISGLSSHLSRKREHMYEIARILEQLKKNSFAQKMLLQTRFPEALFMAVDELSYNYFYDRENKVYRLDLVDHLLEDLSAHPFLKKRVLLYCLPRCRKEEEFEVIEKHIFDVLMPIKAGLKRNEISKKRRDDLLKTLLKHHEIAYIEPPSERVVLTQKLQNILASGRSLIHEAVLLCKFDELKVLVALNADVTTRDEANLTPLDWAKNRRYSQSILARIQNIIES